MKNTAPRSTIPIECWTSLVLAIAVCTTYSNSNSITVVCRYRYIATNDHLSLYILYNKIADSIVLEFRLSARREFIVLRGVRFRSSTYRSSIQCACALISRDLIYIELWSTAICRFEQLIASSCTRVLHIWIPTNTHTRQTPTIFIHHNTQYILSIHSRAAIVAERSCSLFCW